MLNFVGEKLGLGYEQLSRAWSDASSVLPCSFYSKYLEDNHCRFPAMTMNGHAIGYEVLLRTQSRFDQARTRTL